MAFARHILPEAAELEIAYSEYATHSSTILCPNEKLCFQARARHVDDIHQDPGAQLAVFSEFHPWFMMPLPDVLVPLIVLEAPRFWLTITPLLDEPDRDDLDDWEICNAIELEISRRLMDYGVSADIQDGMNIGLDEISGRGFIYDICGLYIMTAKDSHLSLEERIEKLENFRYLQAAQRDDFSDQIQIWQERKYPLVDIITRAQSFLEQQKAKDGYRILFNPNPGIIRQSPPQLSL